MNDNIKKWIIKTGEDFKVVKHELTFPKNEIATGAVCFHCQQAVEKLLKIYLISKKIEFEKTHDLEYLLELCSLEDDEFKKIELGNLNYYAVEIRYPDNFYIPTVEEAKKCFEIAEKVKKFIFKKLGIKDEEII